jgi:hypothetical protein
MIGVSGKLRILCNPFFIMNKLGKGCFESFGTHYRYSISIIYYGKNSRDLRPTCVTTSPRERIEFVSQGPSVCGTSLTKTSLYGALPHGASGIMHGTSDKMHTAA